MAGLAGTGLQAAGHAAKNKIAKDKQKKSDVTQASGPILQLNQQSNQAFNNQLDPNVQYSQQAQFCQPDPNAQYSQQQQHGQPGQYSQ